MGWSEEDYNRIEYYGALVNSSSDGNSSGKILVLEL